jgi:hypothetical protein
VAIEESRLKHELSLLKKKKTKSSTYISMYRNWKKERTIRRFVASAKKYG